MLYSHCYFSTKGIITNRAFPAWYCCFWNRSISCTKVTIRNHAFPAWHCCFWIRSSSILNLVGEFHLLSTNAFWQKQQLVFLTLHNNFVEVKNQTSECWSCLPALLDDPPLHGAGADWCISLTYQCLLSPISRDIGLRGVRRAVRHHLDLINGWTDLLVTWYSSNLKPTDDAHVFWNFDLIQNGRLAAIFVQGNRI